MLEATIDRVLKLANERLDVIEKWADPRPQSLLEQMKVLVEAVGLVEGISRTMALHRQTVTGSPYPGRSSQLDDEEIQVLRTATRVGVDARLTAGEIAHVRVWAEARLRKYGYWKP